MCEVAVTAEALRKVRAHSRGMGGEAIQLRGRQEGQLGIAS